MPRLCRNSSKRSRSSARSIASRLLPSTPKPASCSPAARFIAVCPPNCTITGGPATGCSRPSSASCTGNPSWKDSSPSFSRMSRTLSSSSGSKYSRSEVSKSVETVSGLLLSMMLCAPAARRACALCTLQ